MLLLLCKLKNMPMVFLLSAIGFTLGFIAPLTTG